MKPASWIAFKALLENSPEDQRSHLLGYLPEEDRNLLQSMPPTKGNPIEEPLPFLEQIHFSWFAPFLRTLAERDIRFFLGALSETQAAGLKKNLLFSGSTTTIGQTAKSFLNLTLIEKITADHPDLLPLNCLPASPLTPLLDLKLLDLNTLIDFLGLHDLAVEVTQIIETAKLKAIYNVLTPEEQNYLKVLLQGREPVAFSRIGLTNWKGDPDSLRAILHQRGLNRLGKALYGQDLSFIWYLLHKLDTDQALLLQKLITPLEHATATKLLISQIAHLLSYSETSEGAS